MVCVRCEMLVDYVYNLAVWYEYRNNGYCITIILDV